MTEASRSRRRVWRRVWIYLLAALVIWLLIVWFVQRLVLFPTWAVPQTLHVRPGPDVETLWLETPAAKVEAWFIPGDGVDAEHPGPAVIYAHGNGELIDLWQHDLRAYRDRGISVLLPEYRGYGRSTGSPTQAGITADLIPFHDRLAARPDVDADRIVFHGRSVGGGAVAALAGHRPPRAMILESTFTSVAPLARRFLVPWFLVRDRFDTLAALRQYEGPMLIIHGTQDEVVPVSHARELAQAAENSRLVIYEDMTHNSGPPSERAYWAEIEAFLRDAEVLPSAAGSSAATMRPHPEIPSEGE